MVAEAITAVCPHKHRLSLEERWAMAALDEFGIGVCVCCDGPLRQVRAPVSDFLPGAPESYGYIGIKDRCARCPA